MIKDCSAEFLEFVHQLADLQRRASELEFDEIVHLIGVAELAAFDMIENGFTPESETRQ